MEKPRIWDYEETAIDVLVNVINTAKFQLGERQCLSELANSRNEFVNKTKVSLNSLKSPLVQTAEKFILETIEKTWNLTRTFKFLLRYSGSSQDECSQYYYYEAVFSQPTISYPVPQATVSVFFKVEEKHLEPSEIRGVPNVSFSIEGQQSKHDIRFVTLTADWILAVLKMKIKLFKRIEALKLF